MERRRWVFRPIDIYECQVVCCSGLLLPLLGPEAFCSARKASTSGALQLAGAARSLSEGCQGMRGGPLFFKDLLERETEVAAEAYASLLLRCCRHLAESLILEGECIGADHLIAAPALSEDFYNDVGSPCLQQQSASEELFRETTLFFENGSRAAMHYKSTSQRTCQRHSCRMMTWTAPTPLQQAQEHLQWLQLL